jgi:hypothetical protein
LKAKVEGEKISMLMNRTTENVTRRMRATALWSVNPGMTGAALRVYCSSFIPAGLSFDGALKGRHKEQESQGILDNRQLQM